MADFIYIFIGEHLGNDATDVNSTFPFMGSASSVNSFNIQGKPLDGYFIVGARDLPTKDTRTLINGQHIPHQSIEPGGEQYHLSYVQPGITHIYPDRLPHSWD